MLKLNEHILYIRNKYHPIGQSANNNDPKNERLTQTQIDDATQKLLDSILGITDATKIATYVQELYNNSFVALSSGITKTIRRAELWNDEIESTVLSMTQLEERNKSLNKAFGITSIKAAELAREFRGIAAELRLSESSIFSYADSLKSLGGGFLLSTKGDATFRKNLIASRAVMQGNLGVTDAQAEAFDKYAASLKMTTTQLLLSYDDAASGQNSFMTKLSDKTGLEKTMLYKTIIEEIAGLSSSVRMNFTKMGGKLEVAVLKAKALGVSLTDIQKAGKSLLNIEESVGDELNYQMLTGRRILDNQGNSITNQYRLAYLQKDANKQADLLREAVELQADALDNPVVLSQFADTFKVSEDNVADILTQLELVKKMGAKDLFDMKDPTEISREMARAQQEYIKNAADPTEAEKEFQNLANQFLRIKDKDTRTTHEAVVEDNLSITAAGISKLVGNKDAGIVQQAREASKRITARSEQKDAQGNLPDFTYSPANARNRVFNEGRSQSIALGQMEGTKRSQTLGYKMTKTEIENTLSPTMQALQVVTTKLNDVTSKLVSKFTNTLQDSQKEPTITKAQDALIIPDRGPIIQPAPNDVIAAFRPNDVIDRTLNQINLARSLNQITPTIKTPDQSLVSNQITPDRESILRPRSNDEIVMQKQNSITNNQTTPITNTTNTVENITNRYTQQSPALDINALANAIASAVSKIKVEATIKQDTFLGTTNMNDSRMFT